MRNLGRGTAISLPEGVRLCYLDATIEVKLFPSSSSLLPGVFAMANRDVVMRRGGEVEKEKVEGMGGGLVQAARLQSPAATIGDAAPSI